MTEPSKHAMDAVDTIFSEFSLAWPTDCRKRMARIIDAATAELREEVERLRVAESCVRRHRDDLLSKVEYLQEKIKSFTKLYCLAEASIDAYYWPPVEEQKELHEKHFGAIFKQLSKGGIK